MVLYQISPFVKLLYLERASKLEEKVDNRQTIEYNGTMGGMQGKFGIFMICIKRVYQVMYSGQILR